MSGEGEMISRILETLPVGYRFDPTDEELIHYLKLKIAGMDSQVGIIPEVDLCKWEPWQLPEHSVIKTDDPEWFFFSLLDYKYSKGSRSNRATKAGYWKPTGQEREIKCGKNREVIGSKKTLVFYEGRAPTALKTSWVIHEYRLHIAALPNHRAHVLCRLKRKTDENTESNIPSLDVTVAADTGIHQNNLANNTTFDIGPSYHCSNIGYDFGDSRLEEITSYEGPQLSDLSSDVTTNPLNPNWVFDIYQGLDLDLPSPSSFNFSYGMEFHEGDDFFNFAHSYPISDQVPTSQS